MEAVKPATQESARTVQVVQRIVFYRLDEPYGEFSNFARYPIEFKKGAVCRIDVKTFPAGPGKLRWFLTTKILRGVRK